MKKTTLTPEQKRMLRDRVADAAVMWVIDQGCSSALAALEDAVEEYLGRPIGGTSRDEAA